MNVKSILLGAVLASLSLFAATERTGVAAYDDDPNVLSPTNGATLVYKDFYSGMKCTVPRPDVWNGRYGSHEKNVYHLWLPAGRRAKAPLILYFHGGGWMGGNKLDRSLPATLAYALSNGVAVATANYRFTRDAKASGLVPPVAAPMLDCVAATRHFKREAARWGIDPGRIALSGGSAGACSALWVALSNEGEPVCAVGVNRPQTSLDPRQMRAWIPNVKYGAHAFGQKDFDAWLSNRETLLPSIERFSPIAQLKTVKVPPKKVFLENTVVEKEGELSRDGTHSPRFCLRMKEACDAAGIPCEILRGGWDETSRVLVGFLVKCK